MMASPDTARMRRCRQTAAALIGLALLMPLILGGCARQRQWTRAGITQAAFDQDAARCRREAAKASHGDPFAAAAGQGLERAVAEERIFEQCMFARGYRLEGEPADR